MKLLQKWITYETISRKQPLRKIASTSSAIVVNWIGLTFENILSLINAFSTLDVVSVSLHVVKNKKQETLYSITQLLVLSQFEQ